MMQEGGSSSERDEEEDEPVAALPAPKALPAATELASSRARLLSLRQSSSSASMESRKHTQQKRKAPTVPECLDAIMAELTSARVQAAVQLSGMLPAFRTTEICSSFMNSVAAHMRSLLTSTDSTTAEHSLAHVAVHWSRVLFYCSNFESTESDARFFESFLLLTRCLCHCLHAEDGAAAVARIDVELVRIFRGGLFDPAPQRKRSAAQLSLTPRPPDKIRSVHSTSQTAAQVIWRLLSEPDLAFHHSSSSSKADDEVQAAEPAAVQVFEPLTLRYSRRRRQRIALSNLTASAATRRAAALRVLRLREPSRPTQTRLIWAQQHHKTARRFVMTARSPCIASLDKRLMSNSASPQGVEIAMIAAGD